MPRLKKNASKKAKRQMMQDEMHKFKHGTLHSGAKDGPVVKDRKQAVAIALRQSGQSKRAPFLSKRGRKSKKK